MKSPVRPELPTASVGSSQAPTAAVDNSAPLVIPLGVHLKSGNAVQTNGATSRDNLEDNLYDTEGLDLPHPDHYQLLVVTPGLKDNYQQYLEHFMYPEEAQIVVTHGCSHGRKGLPVLFDVVSTIELEFVGKAFITSAIDEIQSVHEFAIMAIHYPDEPFTKRLLYHSAQLRLANANPFPATEQRGAGLALPFRFQRAKYRAQKL